MKVIHQASSSSKEGILKNGLNNADSGSKSEDPAIAKTDQYLDKIRPSLLIKDGVSRHCNAYAYLSCEPDSVVNITDGSIITIANLKQSKNQTLFSLHIDPARCYVSDLDIYDEVKAAIQHGEPEDVLQPLAKKYWASLQSLARFSMTKNKRPEVMITYHVPPEDIEEIA